MEKTLLIEGGYVKLHLRTKIRKDESTTIYGGKVSNYTTLSISGDIGRKEFGQCIDHILKLNHDNPIVKEIHAIWKRWHLNDLKAGCCHQIDARWNERRIDETKTLDSYGKFFEGQSSNSWNMLAWIRPDEHPNGLLTKPCEICGYRYGSSWLVEEIPAEVVNRAYKLFGVSGY